MDKNLRLVGIFDQFDLPGRPEDAVPGFVNAVFQNNEGEYLIGFVDESPYIATFAAIREEDMQFFKPIESFNYTTIGVGLTGHGIGTEAVCAFIDANQSLMLLSIEDMLSFIRHYETDSHALNGTIGLFRKDAHVYLKKKKRI